MKLKTVVLTLSITYAFFVVGTGKIKQIQNAHLSKSWYPSQKEKLEKKLNYYFSLAKQYFPITPNKNIKALIVPHAGYYFSGLCAATGYQTLKNNPFERVIILGPSHSKNFKGISLPNYATYRTPLGDIPVDQQAISLLSQNSSLFKMIPDIHQQEHSIEVQLPFLQFTLDNFAIVPLIIGTLQKEDFNTVAQTISNLLSDNKKTVIIISSDFIHYGQRFGYTPPFENVIKYDKMAVDAILDKSYSEFETVIKETNATICGKNPIKILLKLIENGTLGHIETELASFYTSAQLQKSLIGNKIDLVKLTNIQPTESSVSYASLIFSSKLTPSEKQTLLKLARNSITESLFPEKKLNKDFTLTENLKKALGIFVTLKTKTGKLRGCIGRIISKKPLYKLVPEIAKLSAFEDHRFSPLTKEELKNTVISITVLTRPHRIKSYQDIEIGKHGIILEKIVDGVKKSAVFLPQVPEEFGWDLTDTLNHLGDKAGLKRGTWKKGSQFKVFEGFEFSE